MFKNIIVAILNKSISFYLRRNHIRVVAVAGSIGKTSTASVIRSVLTQCYKVHQPKTTYNTLKSVHVELFDLSFATSALGWLVLVVKVVIKSFGKAPYEVAVIEIGTDHPGELAGFAWLKPEIGVLTAIAPEHMEYFKTIEAVAKEELVIAGFCGQLICNANAVNRQLVPDDIATTAIWYGKETDCNASNYRIEGTAALADFTIGGQQIPNVPVRVLGEHSLDALLAAAAVGVRFGMTPDEITRAMQQVEAVRGRMRRFAGRNGSVIIDDTYNNSPIAAKAALDVLYQFSAPQRIAVLGSMNEMGAYSDQAHREVGEYCDPERVNMVVTIGDEAGRYLAPAAKQVGCQVEVCNDPYTAGRYILRHLQPGAIVLCKGSQNGVFAEETIKLLLADPDDAVELVRQSGYWLDRKQQAFPEHR